MTRKHEYEKMLRSMGMSKTTASILAATEKLSRELRMPSSSALNQMIWDSMEEARNLGVPKFPSVHDHIGDLYSAQMSAEALGSMNVAGDIHDAVSDLGKFEWPTAISRTLLDQLRELHSPSSLFADYRRMLEMLGEHPTFIGEFEIDEDVDDEGSEGDPILLPEEVHDRLVQVEYIPERLVNAIYESPELMRGLEPREFEKFIAEILRGLGFQNIELTSQSGDGGRDIVAVQHLNGIPILMNFECKRYAESRKIGPGPLRSLLGVCNTADTAANIGVLVTTSTFTQGARKLLVGETRLDGKDFNDLTLWLEKYFLRSNRKEG